MNAGLQTEYLALPHRTGPRRAKPHPTRPNQTTPNRPNPNHGPPHHTEPHGAALSLPNQLAPVRRNYSITQRRRNHARVPMIGTQNMTTTAQRAKILKLVGCQLTAVDMIDLRGFQRHRILAMNTTPLIAFPDRRSKIREPYLTRRTFLRHRFALRTRQHQTARNQSSARYSIRPIGPRPRLPPSFDRVTQASCPT